MADNQPPVYELKLTTANQLIHKGPATLFAVFLAADGANGDCDVYDGENNLAERKVHLEALSGTTAPFTPPCGVRFNNGIYIVVSASTSITMITFQALERHE